MHFIPIGDFRTQTTKVWEKLSGDEDIIITHDGRPQAFLVSVPEGFFNEILMGIRQIKAQIKPQRPEPSYAKKQLDFTVSKEPNVYTSEEMKATWQELRDMLSSIDGGSVDLKALKAERIFSALKHTCPHYLSS